MARFTFTSIFVAAAVFALCGPVAAQIDDSSESDQQDYWAGDDYDDDWFNDQAHKFVPDQEFKDFFNNMYDDSSDHFSVESVKTNDLLEPHVELSLPNKEDIDYVKDEENAPILNYEQQISNILKEDVEIRSNENKETPPNNELDLGVENINENIQIDLVKDDTVDYQFEDNRSNLDEEIQAMIQETKDILNDGEVNDFEKDIDVDKENVNGSPIENVLPEMVDSSEKLLTGESNVENVGGGIMDEYEDVNEDLETLFDKMDELAQDESRNDGEEIKTTKNVVQDYEDQFKRPYGEAEVLRLRDEYYDSLLNEDGDVEDINVKSGDLVEKSNENIDVEKEILAVEEQFSIPEKTAQIVYMQIENKTEIVSENIMEELKKSLQEFEYDDDDEDDDEELKEFYDTLNNADDYKELDKILQILDEKVSNEVKTTENNLPGKKGNIVTILENDVNKSDKNNDETSAEIIKDVQNTDIPLNTYLPELTSEFEQKSFYENGISQANIIPLDSEIVDKMNQFREEHREELDFSSASFNRDVAAVHVILNPDLPVVITSPEYPSPYPADNTIDWVFEGDGQGIELNITSLMLNGAAGDYLLVIPGGIDDSTADGIVFSYQLSEVRKYRFFDVDRMFIRFESKSTDNALYKGFQLSAKFIDAKAEDVTTPEPEDMLPTPEQTFKVYLDLTPHAFHNVSEEFLSIVADMATLYINQHRLETGSRPTREVVQMTRMDVCNIHWPSHEGCTAVTFGVPLDYSQEERELEYRLSEEDLFHMWREHSARDPFAARLKRIGIHEYAIPNSKGAMMHWLTASLGALLLFLLLGIALWRWNCFEDYTRMTRLSESDTVGSGRKSDLSLYPTPHQNLPSMYSDGDQFEVHWEELPPKYSDTARVDMGGFTNDSFVRDGELLDLDSDEEIIMSLPDAPDTKNDSRNFSTVSPRDVYEA